MEHVIYKNIMHHLDDNNIVFANQHGFWKNHSWETQLILAVEDLAMNLDHGGQMDMIILDFCKAFNKVPHQRLISKLQFYGIQGSTLASIKPWLTSWSLSVIVAGVCSKSVVVTSRVPQGTVLGPLMFLLFIVVFAVLLGFIAGYCWRFYRIIFAILLLLCYSLFRCFAV